MTIALATTVFLATDARAQRDPVTTRADSGGHRLACAESGTTLRAWGPGTAGAGPAASPRASLDTTIVLAIADRSWTRSDVDAGVALGVSGTAGAHASPWRACAGVSAHLGTVTARLHQVHGTIRLHADPGALRSIARAPGDSLRTTPPAVPPRR
ncbi:MAG: hypothetical protein JWN79_1437 [Gemmatimonadetes bacterium]|nr:hypothetical protein [Gemmatimonadota bacterium]